MQCGIAHGLHLVLSFSQSDLLMHCSKGFGSIAILISMKVGLVLDSILCVIENPLE